MNLREGRATSHPWDAASLERVQEHIRLSVRGMRAYLRDAGLNLADSADFEKTEDLRLCRRRNFRAVCRPELAPFGAPRGGPPAPPGGAARQRRSRRGTGREGDPLRPGRHAPRLLVRSRRVLARVGRAGGELGRAGPRPLVDALLESRALVLDRPRASPARAHRHAGGLAQDRRGRPRPAPGRARTGFVAGLAEDFAARRRAACRLFPEALDVLRHLRERSTRLALVTNGDLRHQRDKVERHGLGAFFDVILIEGELGVGKPDPVVYRRALDALRAAPADATMVATPPSGRGGPAAAGACGGSGSTARHGGSRPEPDHPRPDHPRPPGAGWSLPLPAGGVRASLVFGADPSRSERRRRWASDPGRTVRKGRAPSRAGLLRGLDDDGANPLEAAAPRHALKVGRRTAAFTRALYRSK